MAEHDVLALLIGVFIDGQEVLIHLQNVPGDFPDQVQGTVADSEVIHGGIDAGFLQRAGHALEIAELHVRDRLCQLDFNQFVRDLVPVHNLQDVFRQAQVDQVPAGEVDGDADRLAVIEDGTLTESGTFKELLQKKGAFYKQYKENGGSNQPPKFVPLRKVFFDANGGSGEMSSIRLGYPADLKTVTLPECSFTAPKKGMAFSGWQVLSETKQPGDEIAPTEDLTVKAIWDYTLLTVSFDANGGTGEQAAITATAEEGFYLPACTFTAPEGQDFSGWQISGNTEKTYAPGDLFIINSDITLVPVWAKTTCAVTFDANGGTGEMDCKTVSVDAEFTFPKCRFIAPEGKEFSAWMIGEIAYEIGDTVTISEDTVIKAVWTDKANTDPVVPISDKKLGDLDGNTKIDVKDAMLLAHYVAKWDGVELDLDACDLNADGTVDQADAMILARYVAGWDGYDKYFESKPV